MPSGVLEPPVLDRRDVHGGPSSGLGQIPPLVPSGNGDDRPHHDHSREPVISNAKLGMLMLLGAETMFFAALVGAFLVLRVGAPVWPPPFQPRLPLLLTGVNTLVLLLGSFTMARAVRSIRRGDQAGLVHGLRLTALLGATFLSVQGYEWVRLVRFGLTVSSGSYGSTFYTLIGAHGVHVLAALIWLLGVLTLARRCRFTARDHAPVLACGMYWQFVVALWPILYLLVYLT